MRRGEIGIDRTVDNGTLKGWMYDEDDGTGELIGVFRVLLNA